MGKGTEPREPQSVTDEELLLASGGRGQYVSGRYMYTCDVMDSATFMRYLLGGVGECPGYLPGGSGGLGSCSGCARCSFELRS